MSVNSVIFANTGAYAALNSMLTAERFQRLSDCKSTAELKKCLTEFGFEGDTADEMFTRAMDDIYAYLNENSSIEKARLAILKKNDYHNAKVMAKCKYVRREITPDLLYPYGGVDAAKMKEWIMNDDYALLPAPMAQALEETDLRFSQGERNGRLIDLLLNRAMYQDIFNTLGHRYGELKNVFRVEVDFKNISVAFRVRKNGLAVSALREEFIDGGKLPYEKVALLCERSKEDIANEFMFSEYKELIFSAFDETEKAALIDFERASDDYIIDMLRRHKNDNSDYMMFYGYVLAKLYELKNVRIVCSGVKAGAPKEEIKAKLRKLYV